MMCAAAVGLTDQREPILFISNPEWDAAMAVSRSLGLSTSYEELVSWAQRVERNHVLGTIIADTCPPTTTTTTHTAPPEQQGRQPQASTHTHLPGKQPDATLQHTNHPTTDANEIADAVEIAGSEYSSTDGSQGADNSDEDVKQERNWALFQLVKRRKAVIQARQTALAELGERAYMESVNDDLKAGVRDVTDWESASDVDDDTRAIERCACA